MADKKNEILKRRAVPANSDSLPAGKAGMICWDESKKTLCLYDGTKWLKEVIA